MPSVSGVQHVFAVHVVAIEPRAADAAEGTSTRHVQVWVNAVTGDGEWRGSPGEPFARPLSSERRFTALTFVAPGVSAPPLPRFTTPADIRHGPSCVTPARCRFASLRLFNERHRRCREYSTRVVWR